MQKTYTKEQLCLLWLAQSNDMPRYRIRQLMSIWGSAQKIFDAYDSELKEKLGRSGEALEYVHRTKDFSSLVSQLQKNGMTACFPGDEEYPQGLENIDEMPDVLYVRGDLRFDRAVAIVGSRRDTRYGRQQTFSIARELAQNGITVVSGMARGIDTAAHEGALAGGGKTIAVLGCGADKCYPPENHVLMENILSSGGAIVSQYPPGTPPLAYHFPLRNRIISGMSDALLLIEARLRSGTNSTVNYALAQGKEVFCLPGNVDAPGSELPLKLLQEGAGLCIRAGDIISAMGWKKKAERAPVQISFTQQQTDDPVLKALQLQEKTFEELIEETGMDPGALGAQLTILQMTGKVEKRAGRAYAALRE